MGNPVRTTDFPSWLNLPRPFMAKLVFDIETSALPPENFDDTQQEYLFREADKIPDEAARATKSACQ